MDACVWMVQTYKFSRFHSYSNRLYCELVTPIHFLKNWTTILQIPLDSNLFEPILCTGGSRGACQHTLPYRTQFFQASRHFFLIQLHSLTTRILGLHVNNILIYPFMTKCINAQFFLATQTNVFHILCIFHKPSNYHLTIIHASWIKNQVSDIHCSYQ